MRQKINYPKIKCPKTERPNFVVINLSSVYDVPKKNLAATSVANFKRKSGKTDSEPDNLKDNIHSP